MRVGLHPPHAPSSANHRRAGDVFCWSPWGACREAPYSETPCKSHCLRGAFFRRLPRGAASAAGGVLSAPALGGAAAVPLVERAANVVDRRDKPERGTSGAEAPGGAERGRSTRGCRLGRPARASQILRQIIAIAMNCAIQIDFAYKLKTACSHDPAMTILELTSTD